MLSKFVLLLRVNKQNETNKMIKHVVQRALHCCYRLTFSVSLQFGSRGGGGKVLINALPEESNAMTGMVHIMCSCAI